MSAWCASHTKVYSTGRTFPTGVAAPALLEGLNLRMIEKVRPPSSSDY